MDIKKYIESGILELYVAGQLSEKENQEVHAAILAYPEIKKEVEEIENAIQHLTKAASPGNTQHFSTLKEKLSKSEGVKVIDFKQPTKKRNWLSYTGWAASILLGVGLIYTYTQNTDLKQQIQSTDSKNFVLEELIKDANESNSKSEELIKIFRDKDIISIALAGQAVSPDSYAKVFWNKKEQTAYIDAAGLPEPPAGKVYQVWSLKLDPLTPTSMGLLSDFANDDNKVFTLANLNDSDAFGITLEPEGGSVSPTLEQLYTLGVVNSTS